VPERGPGRGLLWALGIILLAAALIVLPHLLSLSQQEILVFLVKIGRASCRERVYVLV